MNRVHEIYGQVLKALRESLKALYTATYRVRVNNKSKSRVIINLCTYTTCHMITQHPSLIELFLNSIMYKRTQQHIYVNSAKILIAQDKLIVVAIRMYYLSEIPIHLAYELIQNTASIYLYCLLKYSDKDDISSYVNLAD